VLFRSLHKRNIEIKEKKKKINDVILYIQQNVFAMEFSVDRTINKSPSFPIEQRVKSDETEHTDRPNTVSELFRCLVSVSFHMTVRAAEMKSK